VIATSDIDARIARFVDELDAITRQSPADALRELFASMRPAPTSSADAGAVPEPADPVERDVTPPKLPNALRAMPVADVAAPPPPPPPPLPDPKKRGRAKKSTQDTP